MNERITLISKLNQEDYAKVEELVAKTKLQLCKVPFGKNVDDRIKVDTLPYHFTLYSWNISKKEEVIFFLKNIKYTPLVLNIDKICTKLGSENSYVLYLNIETNQELSRNCRVKRIV